MECIAYVTKHRGTYEYDKERDARYQGKTHMAIQDMKNTIPERKNTLEGIMSWLNAA